MNLYYRDIHYQISEAMYCQCLKTIKKPRKITADQLTQCSPSKHAF